MPYSDVQSSTAAKTGTNGQRERDTRPPTRLPNPNPSMNAVTTTVTDSTLTP
jgi:hypothetical protein